MHGPGTRRGGRVAPVRLQRLPARCLAASRWRTSTASLHIGLCPPTHGSKGRVPIPPRLTLWVTGDSQSPEVGARLGGGDAGFAAVNRTAARKCKLRPSSSVRGPKNSAKRPVVPKGGSPGQLTFRLVGSTPPATLKERHGFDPRWGCPRSEATRLLRRRAPSCRPSGHPNPGKRWIPKAAGRARRCSGEAASLLPRNTAEHRDPPCSPRWHRGSPPTSDESTPLRRGDVWVLLEGGSGERRPESRHGAVGTNRSGDDRSHLRRGRYRHRPWSAPMGRRCCRCGAPDSRRFGVGLPPVGLRHPSRTTSPTKNSCDGRR